MTTNQTIDGVPRELLERAISATMVARGPGSPTERDLRALLDAPFESQYDGMTREQAQAVSDGVDGILFGKPTCERADFEGWCVSEDMDPKSQSGFLMWEAWKARAQKPADQPQGDTVPVSAHWSDWSMVTLEIEGKHRTYVEFCKPLQKPVAWKTGSITWAYEPDAQRHGDQYGVLVKPLYDRPDCREPDYYRIKTPKTLVNGVPTEWFPAVMFYAKSELPKDGMYRVIERLYAEQPAPVAVVMPQFEPAFEKWWEDDGQFCRAGGGSYEKTFAYRAYEAALSDVTRLNTK